MANPLPVTSKLDMEAIKQESAMANPLPVTSKLDMEAIMQMLAKDKQWEKAIMQMLAKDKQRENQFKTEYLSFRPPELKSNVIFMEGRQWKIQEKPTIFVAITTQNYNSEMWKVDVTRWRDFLQIQEPFGEILLTNIEDRQNVLNAFDAFSQIEKIKDKLYTLPNSAHLRFVLLGEAYSKLIHKAIEYLLRDWCDSNGVLRTTKDVEFFTVGDSPKHIWERFCKWLCVTGTCTSLIFVNTNDYAPFGYAKREFKK
jgi:hypothetical protein